jgi:UDP-galactopyranose mutase
VKFDWLVVGAGLTGSVLAERIASQLDQRVLVVERRDHIAGNTFDHYDHHGVLVHKYGPHIFHTNNAAVWNYLSRFTEWIPYYHFVLGSVGGKLVPVPFNLNSLYALFPPSYAATLENKLLATFGLGTKIPVLKLRETDDAELKHLADYVYRNVFEGYTLKQWAMKPEQLDPGVTARVPISISRDDRYFQDTYQAMPRHGYSEMCRRILAHPNIKLLLKTDYREIAADVRCGRIIYTGEIDTFFNKCHGALPYRSLRFEYEHAEVDRLQPVGQINYPNDQPFTRTTEFKHLTGQRHSRTTVAREYSEEYVEGRNEAYYPIPTAANRELYARYEREAESLNGSVLFAGRLADYKYYNMDQAVARSLSVFEKQVLRSLAMAAKA